ncbi:hypothetical protein C8P63_11772 [Melghirimyces profundicolus]|uniref:Uncharacterized protein n=1 Tax=Melghirimyces profundicolus TaxID=1242148 RepID=A0A2T6BQJ6_9BACL|nr:hypothetical protein C8P63_11772 [Melghirimyces profundicolus]
MTQKGEPTPSREREEMLPQKIQIGIHNFIHTDTEKGKP